MLREILNTLRGKVSDKVSDKVPDKSELAVLKLLMENPRLTKIELSEQSGISEGSIKKIISKLKSAGWLERVGSNKTGYWLVKYPS